MSLHILPPGFSEFLVCRSGSKQCCLMMYNKQKLNMEEPSRNVLNTVCYDTLLYRQQLLYLSEKSPKSMFKIYFNSFASTTLCLPSTPKGCFSAWATEGTIICKNFQCFSIAFLSGIVDSPYHSACLPKSHCLFQSTTAPGGSVA